MLYTGANDDHRTDPEDPVAEASTAPPGGLETAEGDQEKPEENSPQAWEGIKLLASRLQAVPYATAFLSQSTGLLLRLIANKVSLILRVAFLWTASLLFRDWDEIGMNDLPWQ